MESLFRMPLILLFQNLFPAIKKNTKVIHKSTYQHVEEPRGLAYLAHALFLRMLTDQAMQESVTLPTVDQVMQESMASAIDEPTASPITAELMEKSPCVLDTVKDSWVTLADKGVVYLMAQDYHRFYSPSDIEDTYSEEDNDSCSGSDGDSCSDSDDDSSNIKRPIPETAKVWDLFDFPKLTLGKAIHLEVAERSRNYVCANKRVVVVDSKTWNMYLLDLVSGECISLPALSPEEYIASPKPKNYEFPGLKFMDYEDDKDEKMFLHCTTNCVCWLKPSNEMDVAEFISKVVMDDAGDAKPSILVAMLSPEVCIETSMWGDKVLAYCMLDDKKQPLIPSWTPIYAFAPHWYDGVFHKSRFLLLTDPAHVLRTFSFEGIVPGGQPQIMQKFTLDSWRIDKLPLGYIHVQLAVMDDTLYLVHMDMSSSMDGYGFVSDPKPPSRVPVVVHRLRYDPVRTGVMCYLEQVTDLGGKALFVGDIAAFSVEVDGSSSLQPDTVYFGPRDYVCGARRILNEMHPLGWFNLKTLETKVLGWDHRAYPNKVPLFV